MKSAISVEIRRGAEIIGEYRFTGLGAIEVGRSTDADVIIASVEISRKHFAIQPASDGFVIDDFSLNGVRCEGARVQSGDLLPFGSVVEVGSYLVAVSRHNSDEGKVNPRRVRRIALAQLVDELNLAVLDRGLDELRPRVEAVLERIVHEEGIESLEERIKMVGELADEALGLGPLEKLLSDEDVSEIMVVDKDTVFAERSGRIEKTELTFSSEDSVRTVIERIITPLGRRIDESSPMVDARLPDGSRVNAIIPPLAVKGPCITIRKFAATPLQIEDLIGFGTIDKRLADFLCDAVRLRRNIVISGGTGSGKTTLLNVLAGSIPSSERIVTIEDAAELRLPQPHVVTLESRPANAEGNGQVAIRDLVRNSLRMRPDRIVVGECRGGEALDMLQAMNTGHDGSLTTTHANSPAEAIGRLETLCLMAGVDLPSRAIREQIGAAVDLVVQQTRFSDGARRVTSVAQVSGLDEDSRVRLNPLYEIEMTPGAEAPVFQATGWLPFLDRA